MGRFNIRKATQRKERGQQDSPDMPKVNVPKDNQSKDGGLQDTPPTSGDKLNKLLELFDSIVTHGYLTRLSTSPIANHISESIPGMGWYRVTKIVMDKEDFFPDRLSMLYTALHSVASNVALVIDKKGFDNIEIYMGARDFSGTSLNASSLLYNAAQGYLPGVESTYYPDKTFLPGDDKEKLYVGAYSGIASLRDDKKEDFIQGIEKFIDATPTIPQFTALFIADNVSRDQATWMINAFSRLEDSLSPLVQVQQTVSESHTEGVSKTITETIGQTFTESLSETVTRTEGTNESYSSNLTTTDSENVTKNPNILKALETALTTALKGGEHITSVHSQARQDVESHGRHNDTAKANQKGSSLGNSQSKATADQSTSNTTTGISHQITYTNTQAKRYIDMLNRHIDRLQNGIPYGLWSIGTYFVSPSQSTSLKLATIYKGCITGEQSDMTASAVNVWDEQDSKALLPYLRETRNPRFIFKGINVSAGVVVTSKELAVHMSLPQGSIPGVVVRERATFGRNLNIKAFTENGNQKEHLAIGVLTHLGMDSSQKVLLEVEELSKHVFVTGSTGSGKSNTTYLLVKQLLEKGKKVLIIEPTKGDYRKVFGGRPDVTVYGTRTTDENQLRINPFAFPEEIMIEEHVERLVEIFGVCWPMYAAMPAVLKDSIFAAYKACGWDLATSTCKYGRLFPTINDVVAQLKRIIASSEYSANTKGDYVGSLQTRLNSLTNGVYSTMLTSDPVPYRNLYDENVIIDLHRIGSSETRSLIMGLLVLSLTEWRSTQSEDTMDKELRYVTVLEEAHCILPRVSKQQSQESSNVVGKSVEMIASSIAEMRSYGQGFIIVDQSPSAVDEAAIRNTNTKIIMNLPDGDDREIAGKSMGLIKDLQIAELAKLATGEAVVFQRGWDDPVMASIHELPKEDRHPQDNQKAASPLASRTTNKPSDTFISTFITSPDSTLSEGDKKSLKEEIQRGKGDSGEKVVLLESLEGRISRGEQVNEAIIGYLGLKTYLTEILDSGATIGAGEERALRKHMAHLNDIIDTNTQNHLLYMAFNWAYGIDRWRSLLPVK